MDSSTVIFHIHSETLNDLSHANVELIQGLHWHLAQKDLAAFEKFYPVVSRMTVNGNNYLVIRARSDFPELINSTISYGAGEEKA
jgi:hypothetical protein